MRKTSEILRLKHEVGLTNRQIAASLGLTHPTVSKYLAHALEAGLTWPLPEELDEDRLDQRLFPAPDVHEISSQPLRPLPDMAHVHKELRRQHVTLQLLWEEYRLEYPDGYGYTQFCEYYKRWKAPLEVTLRQRHIAGEKTFLDWAGKTLRWTHPEFGQEYPAFLFVAALGASDYMFAEAWADQTLDSWIEAHIHMVEFYDGVSRLWVPDNAKTGVVKPCYYEPQIHATYQELADHYDTAILPTRTYRPRDKAKVENAVLHAERRIMARLRDQEFFSLGSINEAIRRCLSELNARPFQKMAGSRLELYHELDRPALRPLPSHRYQLGEWKKAKANIDYHVQVDWHNYSVPYQLTQQLVDVRLAARTVELFHKGRRVAAHVRSRVKGGFTTDPAHRPKAHEKHLAWTPGRLIRWARAVGPLCSQAVTYILENKPHPEQGYRSCMGILRLAKGVGHERMEAACRRALALDAVNYPSIASILKTKLDQQPLPEPEEDISSPVGHHDNIRGQAYYQTQEALNAPDPGS
jgi:transposase|tara:strand:+ start:247 stop:1818 length:1572 start_codon:yes stop_codon:yes gene_type:complete